MLLLGPRSVSTHCQFSSAGAAVSPNTARPGPARSSYTITSLSSAPVASRRPEPEKRTAFTGPRWSLSVANSCGTPFTSSAALTTGPRAHTFALWSPPAVARRTPSEDTSRP